MKNLSLSLAFALACVCAPIATAQAPQGTMQAPVCDGTTIVVRVSEIKPGKKAEFLAAVAAQLAWYRTNGVTTNDIYAARMLSPDTTMYSDTQFMTFHVNPPRMDTKLPRGDDAYKAFVKQFRESSDIKSEYSICRAK